MSENKRKKKKKRGRNNSSKMIIQRGEGKFRPVRENIDESRSCRRGIFADCYQMVYSRIANAFVPRNHHGLNEEGNINVDCIKVQATPQNSISFPETTDSLSRECKFEYQSKTENHSRDDLFEAMLELCKPRPRPDDLFDKPMKNFLNFYHDIDKFPLSLLIELFNNEPYLSTYNLKENIHFGSDILEAVFRKGSFCSMHMHTKRRKPNRRYEDQNKIPATSDRHEVQEMLGKTIDPVFFFCPCYVCRSLTTSLLVDKPKDTVEKATQILCGQEYRVKVLPLSLEVRQDVDRREYLARRIDPQDVHVNVSVTQGNGENRNKIMHLLTGTNDTRGEMSRNIEVDTSVKRRLEINAAHLMTVPAVSTGCTIENAGLCANLHQDCHLNTKLQTLTEKKWTFSDLFRLSFKVGQVTNTIVMNFPSTKEFWRLVQPLQNYLQIRQTTTQRHRYAVVQCKSSEQMIDVTVDVPGRECLSISFVPLSLLEMLIHKFSRRLTAVDVENTVVSSYQVPAYSRYGPASISLYLKNQNQRTCDENLTVALQQGNSYTFWQQFPRQRDVYELPTNNTTGDNSDTATARLDDPKVTDAHHKPDRELIATNLEVEESEEYDSFDILEPCIKRRQSEWDHPKGTRGRDYQTFDVKVPDSLMCIQVPSIDITDIQFKTDTDGNRMLFVSGGFGDIFQARLSTTGDEVIVKKVINMKYKDVLRETKIQTYLMADGFVPKMLGVIGGPGQPETMVVQQIFSKGRTLNDLIEACLAEAIVLFTSHWLELCYKLAVNLGRMHNKGILHNDIKADNILVDVRPNDVRIYYIDFGQASFRSGSILLPPDECDDSEDLDDYIAPEVRSGFHSSPKSDIYSLGVIFGDIADEFCECLGPLADEMCYDKPRKRLTLEEVSEQIEELIMEDEYN